MGMSKADFQSAPRALGGTSPPKTLPTREFFSHYLRTRNSDVSRELPLFAATFVCASYAGAGGESTSRTMTNVTVMRDRDRVKESRCSLRVAMF